MTLGSPVTAQIVFCWWVRMFAGFAGAAYFLSHGCFAGKKKKITREDFTLVITCKVLVGMELSVPSERVNPTCLLSC